jgi:hypothetical protein
LSGDLVSLVASTDSGKDFVLIEMFVWETFPAEAGNIGLSNSGPVSLNPKFFEI